MDLSRNAAIAARFAARALSYDEHAALQRQVAERLAGLLPPLARPKVLEIGCGTGFLAAHLLDRYPNGDFLITDLAPEMLERCRARLPGANGRAVRYDIMDGEMPDCHERFDLIATSMTLQWFADPLAGVQALRRLLKPAGTLHYATVGPDSFPEWRKALAREGLPCGVAAMPPLPGRVREEREPVAFDDAHAFLARLKGIGATMPRQGYRPLPSGHLRRALRRLDRDFGGRVTWQIVYGRLAAAGPGGGA